MTDPLNPPVFETTTNQSKSENISAREPHAMDDHFKNQSDPPVIKRGNGKAISFINDVPSVTKPFMYLRFSIATFDYRKLCQMNSNACAFPLSPFLHVFATHFSIATWLCRENMASQNPGPSFHHHFLRWNTVQYVLCNGAMLPVVP